MLLTLGSDMEIFGKKEGEHKALCGLIGGSKEQPLQLKGLPKGYMVQEDNVALEFNIPVCASRSDFVKSFQTMREQTTIILSKLGMELSPEASASFAESELSHPNALVFGCEPDFNAWMRKENMRPTCDNPFLRTCGGHIHVGSKADMVQGVENMDLLLGVPSVLLDDKPSSNERRKLYGKAGAMRPKPYGWEYRVLSNFWFFEDKNVVWVYNQTKRACEMKKEWSEKEGQTIQHCINTGDKKLAEKLIAKYKIEMPVVYEEPKPKRSFSESYMEQLVKEMGIAHPVFTTNTIIMDELGEAQP